MAAERQGTDSDGRYARPQGRKTNADAWIATRRDEIHAACRFERFCSRASARYSRGVIFCNL